MKKGALILLIAWSLIAVAFTVVLILALNGVININLPVINIGGGISIQNVSGEYREISKQTVSGDITSLDISWVAGELWIEAGDTDTITVTEYCPRELTDGEKLMLSENNGTLTIEYRTDRSIHFMPQKKLVITIPEGMIANKLKTEATSALTVIKNITINGDASCTAVSGEIELYAFEANNIGIFNVSGDLKAENIKAKSLDTDAVSGRVNASGDIGKMSSDSVSGDVTATFSSLPTRLDINTVSGEVEIYLPKDSVIDLDYSSASGNLSNALDTSHSAECVIEVDTISGNLTVK